MKKKLLIALLFSILSFNRISYAQKNSQDIAKVILNGRKIDSEVPPTIVDNRIFIPVRNVVESVGGQIEWIPNDNSVTIHYNDSVITFGIEKNMVLVNGVEIYIEQSPFIKDGRTMIPLRFIATQLNMNVEWVDRLKTASVTEKNYYNNLSNDVVMGFTVSYYEGDNLSYNSVKNTESLNMVSVFSYSFLGDGSIIEVDKPQNSTLNYCLGTNIKPIAVIHNINNGNFDKELIHKLLINSEKRASLINNIVMMLMENEYMGVNIDFENISRDDKDLFSNFIKELKDELTKYGYLTIISIPAKTSDRYTSSWNYAFDYEKLGNIADYIMIMTYDEHYTSSSAGAIASIDWVKNVLDYSKEKIPQQKIILGLALYGYDWVKTSGQAVPTKNILKLANTNNVAPKWDSISKTPYFSYIKDNKYHEVWYENEESLKIKIELAKSYNLGGIGFWRLGLEETGFLDKILK